MENEKVVSLCVSIISGIGGAPLLFRLADVHEDGYLVPFKIDRTIPIEDYNIDRIYDTRFPRPAEGTMQLIEWTSYYDEEKGKFQQQTQSYNLSIRWIEYIRLPNVKSVDQFKAAIIEGLNFDFDEANGYLIEICKMGDSEYMCAYFEASDFVSKANGLNAIDDKSYKLDVYTVKHGEFADAQTRFIPNFFKLYYTSFALPNKTATMLVRDPAEIVKNVVLQRIRGCTVGFSKTERSTVRNFLSKCDTSSIIDIIADHIRCSHDEALSFFDEFIANCSQYFSDEDFLHGLLLDFIGNENDVAQRYREELRDEWEQEIESEMQKAHDELLALDKKRELATHECDNIIDRKSKLEADLQILQNEYRERLRLADEIDEQVRQKIVAAQANLADFFAEYAVFAPQGVSQQATVVRNSASSTYIEGCVYSEEYKEITAEELLEYLTNNLTTIGVDNDKVRALAAYLMAACSLKIPLIFAGYGAVELADVISITLFNKTADRIYADNGKGIDMQGNEGVLIAFDAFGCMDKILVSAKRKLIFFVAQTSEELSIEPRSIYNYALPIFTEYFITEESESDEVLACVLQGEISTNNKEPRKARVMLPIHCLPKLAFSRIKNLLNLAQDFHGRYEKNDLFMLQVMPVMLSLSMKEELKVLIAQNFQDTKNAFRLIGENDESNVV
jgi:hypothetical protein